MSCRLLNIASIVCLVLCVAFIGLWLRSYRTYEVLTVRLGSTQAFSASNERGRIPLIWFTFSARMLKFSRSWAYYGKPLNEMQDLPFTPPHTFGFDTVILSDEWIFVAPYWFLVLTSGSSAMLFRLRWPWRFTLRSLFVVTTFLAVVLGMIAWLDRGWIGQ
jgi:hypothetical protein